MDSKIFWKGYILGGVISIIVASICYYKMSEYTKVWEKELEERSKQLEDLALHKVETYNLKGENVSLNQYKGKPLVLNFWATWCGPCLIEFPHFEEMRKEVGEEINFVMISDEDINKILDFTVSKPYGFTFLRSDISLKEYGLKSIPKTYFYNARGLLIKKHTGGLDYEDLKKIMRKIR